MNKTYRSFMLKSMGLFLGAILIMLVLAIVLAKSHLVILLVLEGLILVAWTIMLVRLVKQFTKVDTTSNSTSDEDVLR